MKRIVMAIACTLFAAAYLSNPLQAQSRDPESLKGLKGIRLTIMFGRAEAMDEAQKPMVLKLLQDDARAKCQKAGIPLLEYANEVENAPGSPHFIVVIIMDIPNGHVFPVVTRSRLPQKVRLSRDPSIDDMAGVAAAQFSRVLVVPRGGPVMSSVRVQLGVSVEMTRRGTHEYDGKEEPVENDCASNSC